jgi:hypothetical protein
MGIFNTRAPGRAAIDANVLRPANADPEGCCKTPSRGQPRLIRGPIMTRLDRPLRRELDVAGKTFTLTIDPTGLKLSEKGRRNGVTLSWVDLLNGDAALAAALQASTTGASHT